MASSSCVVTESSPLAAPERVISELTRGREIADRLLLLLRQTEFDDSPDSLLPARSLATQLLDTFSMLRDGAVSDKASQAVASVVKSEDSGDSYKTPAAKDRRGCYKRKRNSDTLVKDTPNLLEDGHAWRKYGQKVILHATHPRVRNCAYISSTRDAWRRSKSKRSKTTHLYTEQRTTASTTARAYSSRPITSSSMLPRRIPPSYGASTAGRVGPSPSTSLACPLITRLNKRKMFKSSH